MLTPSSLNFFPFIFTLVFCAQNVPLSPAGNNYYAPLKINDQTYRVIIDSGNSASLYVTYPSQTSLIYNLSDAGPPCFSLQEDGFYLNFLNLSKNKSYTCPNDFGRIKMSGAEASGNYSVFLKFKSQNPSLNNWTAANGDIGLAYCGRGTNCKPSIFQNLLLNETTSLTEYELFGNTSYIAPVFNSSEPLVVGLDFQGSNGGLMQMGEIDPLYQDKLVWAPIQTSTPLYQQFEIQNLNICNINLFANWSYTWPAIIDTGSSCLSLPAEMFDSFVDWYNNSAVASADQLPAFSFSMADVTSPSQERMNNFFVPLGSLLLPNSTHIGPTGGPSVTVGGVQYSLCVIRGSSISTGNVDGTLSSGFITLGAMVLKSIYFTADYASGHVGFASKLIDIQQQFFASSASYLQCYPRASCIGQQKYVYNYNKCITPSCSHYFFTTVDTSTQTCKYSNGALGVGFAFIGIILLIEISAFFIMQSTTYDFILSEDDGGDPTHQQQKSQQLKKIDFISRIIGKGLCYIVDGFIIHILRASQRAFQNI